LTFRTSPEQFSVRSLTNFNAGHTNGFEAIPRNESEVDAVNLRLLIPLSAQRDAGRKEGVGMPGNKFILIVLVSAFFVTSSLFAGNGKGGPGSPASGSGLSATETADLLFMREEEKMARDVYDELYSFYKAEGVELLIFARIASSEQNHMDAILNLLEKYELEDPAEGKSRGEFENTTLAALYQNLTSTETNDVLVLNEPTEGGKVEPLAAFYVGAWIEERDMLDIMQAISNTAKNDLVRVYTNLLCGSRSHLRSFVRQIGANNYEPQILDLSELEYWLGSDSDEICG
jgi:hypothetical protein